MSNLVTDFVELGLIYALVVMGMHFTSRLIAFDDLSVEGSFGLGGAVTAWVGGVGGIPISIFVGCLTGMCTAYLHLRLRLNGLISGICVTTAAFSLALALVGPNVVIVRPEGAWLICLAATTLSLMGVLKWLLHTEIGYMILASGQGPGLVGQLGKNPNQFRLVAFVIASGLTGLAGALFVLWSGFFSVTGSIGTLIIGLSGLIIGRLFSPRFGIGLVLGAIAYQALFALTIAFGLNPIWNNFIKAVLIIILLRMGHVIPAQNFVQAR